MCSIKSLISEESDCASSSESSGSSESLDCSSDSVIFLSLGGTLVDVEYELEKYVVPQIL